MNQASKHKEHRQKILCEVRVIILPSGVDRFTVHDVVQTWNI